MLILAGVIQRKGDASGEAISVSDRITITSLSNSRMVTGVANISGNLKVIVWDVDAGGSVLQKGIGFCRCDQRLSDN
jgi:hypothetical protein